MFRRLRNSDEGFTLAEMAMYGLLLGLVVATAAGIMMSGTVAEKTVRNVFGASTVSQLTADSIETGIRNASGYVITAPTTGTQLLRARTAQGTTSLVWSCAAWYYSPTLEGGSIYYKSSSSAILPADTSNLTTWTKLVTGVKPSTGTTIFSVAGDQLKFSFKTAAGTNDPPAGTSSSATSRADVWETAPCF